MGELSKVEGSAQSHLAFRGLSCWEALVTLYLWFRFLTWSMIAICSRFCSPGGGVMFLWELWVLFSLGWPFQGCWGVYGLWLRLRAGRARLSFRGSSCWGSVIGACGRLGEGGASLWAVSKIESSVGVPHLHRFILLRSFSDFLLVVSVLDIVMIALCSRLCSPEGVKTIKLLQALSLTISLI